MMAIQKTVLPMPGGISVTHERGPNRWGQLCDQVTVDTVIWGGFDKFSYRLTVKTYIWMADGDIVRGEVAHEGGVFF